MQTEEPAERHHASYLRAWAAYMLLVLVVWGPIKAALMWVGIEHWVEPHASPQRAW